MIGGYLMLKKLAWKNIFIGTFIIVLLTTFVQKVLLNVRIIHDNNILIDFLSWVAIYIFIALIATGVKYFSRNIKGIYRFSFYVIAIVIIILLTFIIAFLYKTKEINEYEKVLSMMNEKEVTEIETLLENKEDFIFLLTSEDCPYCIDLLPTISKNVNENDAMPIYYVKRENDKDSVIKELLDAETIPFLIRIEQGKIVQNYFENPINFFD